ncbi:MAG: hypothetical protein HZC55_21105 [Verrucomicrobia bacterium]|nr:hypothetical protein [Verrucomicrobiota bacterium]
MATDSQLSILIDIRAQLAELTRAQEGFRGAREEAQSFGSALRTGLGIDLARRGLDLLTNSIRQSVGEAFRLAGAIKDQSENLSLSTEAYQVLGHVLKEAGGDMQLLTQWIAQSNRSLAEARNLASGAAGAYRTLGLDPAKLEGLAVEHRLETIARAIAQAKDQTAAYGAASQIVGSRNLPTLLGAMRTLAAEGFGPLATAARAAGQVMERDTVLALDRAAKQIEKARRQLQIQLGKDLGQLLAEQPAFFAEATGGLFDAFDVLIRRPFQGIGAMTANAINFAEGRGFTFLEEANALQRRLQAELDAAEKAKETADRRARADAASAEAAQLQRLAEAELALARAQLERQAAESDPLVSNEAVRRDKILAALEKEIAARKRLLALQAEPAASGAANEDPAARQLRQAKGEAELQAATAAHTSLKYPLGARARAGIAAAGVEDPRRNPNALQLREGIGAGVDQWIAALGSRGEQAAAAVQASLGATVQGIGDGIFGWLTGVESFGNAMRNLVGSIFRTMLQTVVQMGVQWLVNTALIKTGMLSIEATADGLRAARVVKENAAEAATMPAKMSGAAAASVSSFGLAAVLGIAALLAAMAAFGGFREHGGGVVAGRAYVVGEKRPELFVPHTGGTIIPSLEGLSVAPAAAAVSVAAPSVSASATLAGAAGSAGSGRPQRLIAIVPDLASARALQRDPNFENVIVDVVQRRRGEILG